MITWSDSVAEVRSLLACLPAQVGRAAEYAYLAGESAHGEYRAALTELGHIIEHAKRVHAELSGLSTHRHQWNDDDYCDLCGADGRA